MHAVCDDISVNITDVNYGILLMYDTGMNSYNGTAHTDIDLQVLISFGFIEETA